MKNLPLKLGISVVLLFAAVIAACLLWTPVTIRWYVSKYHSDNVQRCANSINGLLSAGVKGKSTLHTLIAEELKNASDKRRIIVIEALMSVGEAGIDIVAEILDGGKDAALFLVEHWNKVNEPIQNPDAGVGSGEFIGFNSLGISACKGYRLVSDLLIARGADLNTRDFCDLTPLIYVLIKKDWAIAELLIKKGADLSVNSWDGQSPLHIAVNSGNLDIATLLVRYGADVDATDNDGNTLLQVAVTDERVNIANLLINNGADINAKLSWMIFSSRKISDVEGSLLHFASESSSGEIVQLLIDAGLNVNALDSKGYTSLDIALEEENEQIASILRAHGGKTGEELKKESGE